MRTGEEVRREAASRRRRERELAVHERLRNEEEIDICNYTLAIIADTTAARASAVRRAADEDEEHGRRRPQQF